MAQSLGHSNFHLVFSTKERRPYITPDLAADLYGYICGICQTLKCPVYAINGMPDHIHIFLEQHRTICTADLVSKIKSNSSRWAKAEEKGDRGFTWQRGYGYFAVGRPQFEAVKTYVIRQQEHHATVGFQDEMRAAFRKAGISFDERYVWD